MPICQVQQKSLTLKQLEDIQFSKRRIKSFLARSNYSRGKTAALCGVNESTWGHWVSGRRSPSLKKLQEIAPAFEMTVGEMAEAICLLIEKNKK